METATQKQQREIEERLATYVLQARSEMARHLVKWLSEKDSVGPVELKLAARVAQMVE